MDSPVLGSMPTNALTSSRWRFWGGGAAAVTLDFRFNTPSNSIKKIKFKFKDIPYSYMALHGRFRRRGACIYVRCFLFYCGRCASVCRRCEVVRRKIGESTTE